MPIWPTPAAGVFNDSEDPAQWMERRTRHATKDETPTRASMPLAIAAKLWPTPISGDAQQGMNATYARGNPSLGLEAARWAEMWPTATTQDAHASARHGYMLTGHSGTTLTDAIRAWEEWRTPLASDSHRGMTSRRIRSDGSISEDLPAQARHWASRLDRSTEQDGSAGSEPVSLNPSFVEALMGFPIGWTALPRSETLSLKL